MIIVKHVDKPCGCLARLAELEQAQAAAGRPLHIGSVVECDCGKQYRFSDDQRGAGWIHTPRGCSKPGYPPPPPVDYVLPGGS